MNLDTPEAILEALRPTPADGVTVTLVDAAAGSDRERGVKYARFQIGQFTAGAFQMLIAGPTVSVQGEQLLAHIRNGIPQSYLLAQS